MWAAGLNTMTMTLLPWALLSLAGFAGTWLGCARFYQRKLDRLRQLQRAERQTAAEHFQQARRQIGQLQAELAKRPAALRPPETPEPVEPTSDEVRAALIDRVMVLEDGFPKTMIGPQGFMPTQLMR